MISLRTLAAALGGDVSGHGVLAPGPGHSPRDRSLSIVASAASPCGFIVHSHAGDDWRDCHSYVCERLGLPAFKAPERRPVNALQNTYDNLERKPAYFNARHEYSISTVGAPKAAMRDKAALAARLWNTRNPITEDCPAWLYLRQTRGYAGAIPATLGYLPANGKHAPAMIAAFGFCEEPEPGLIDPPANVTGVHITRLTPDGSKSPEDKPKIMLGPSAGLPIVLAPVNDLLGMAITEGIEDGLSVFAETGLGIWAAGSAGNIPKIAAAIPSYVECVTIFAHRDETGMRFAKEAARLIAAMGTEVHLKGRG